MRRADETKWLQLQSAGVSPTQSRARVALIPVAVVAASRIKFTVGRAGLRETNKVPRIMGRTNGVLGPLNRLKLKCLGPRYSKLSSGQKIGIITFRKRRRRGEQWKRTECTVADYPCSTLSYQMSRRTQAKTRRATLE